MYKIGDNVVYGQNGVMTVLDIRKETVLGEERKYYVLHAHGTGEDSLTFVPCDNVRLTAEMRPLMTVEEVNVLLDEVKKAPDFAWIEDSRLRNTAFKKLLIGADYAELLRMIFAIEEKLGERAETGKRSYLSDEVIMKKAKRLVFSEFSCVLGFDYEETEQYIAEKLK